MMNWHEMSNDQRAAVIRAGIADGKTLTSIGRAHGIGRNHAARSIRYFCEKYGIPYTLDKSAVARAAAVPRNVGWNSGDEDAIRVWVERQDRDFVAAVRKFHFGVPA